MSIVALLWPSVLNERSSLHAQAIKRTPGPLLLFCERLIFPTAWLFWVSILTCSQAPTLIHHQGCCFSDNSVGRARTVIFDIANGRWAFDLLKSLLLFQNPAPRDLTGTCICHNQLPGARLPSSKSSLLVATNNNNNNNNNNSAIVGTMDYVPSLKQHVSLPIRPILKFF